MSMQKIIGHHEQKKMLQKFVLMPKIHHAFLFIGPEYIGKHLMAHAFAQKLIQGTADDVWNINERPYSDIVSVAPIVEQKKGRNVVRDISVRQILDARRSFALTADKKAKVLIINDAHRMTITAQNALLKTLEEPTRNGFIILVSNDHDRLLDTIRSRCMHVRFSILDNAQLRQMSDDESVIVNAQGCPGYVQRMQTDESFLACVTTARDELRILAKTRVHERMQLAADLAKKDDQYIHVFFSVWIHRIWSVAHETQKPQLIKAAGKIDDVLYKITNSNVNKQLIIEDLLLHIV